MTRNPVELIEDLDTIRIIGHIKGRQPGPTLVFFGGIHGNEPSGIFALYSPAILGERVTTGGAPHPLDRVIERLAAIPEDRLAGRISARRRRRLSL